MLSARSLARAAARSTRSFASSSKAAQAAAPAQAAHDSAAPSYTPSIMEKLFGTSKTPRVPLDVPWPGLVLPQARGLSPIADQSGPAQISTLPSGIRVATLPSASPIASVGVFVDGGSRYETPDNNGITHFLELMSLKSTTNRSDFRLVRDMLKLGANGQSSRNRKEKREIRTQIITAVGMGKAGATRFLQLSVGCVFARVFCSLRFFFFC